MSSRRDNGRVIPLPLASHHSANRSSTTCKYRCGNACQHEAPNTSGNAYFGDVVEAVLNRRRALKATGALALTVGGAAALGGTTVAAPSAPARNPVPGTEFPPVAPNTRDAVVVADGYQQGVVIRWGDPVVEGAPEFDPAHQSAAAQEEQFGYNNDFAELIALDRTGAESLLVCNHEYTSEEHMFLGYDENNPTEEQVKIAWAAHGLSVVKVERQADGSLKPAPSRYNRRITLTTPFELRGPAAGSDLLKTSADPTGTTVLGTQNNCSGSLTPWGTILSGEENINQYFAHADAVTDPVARERLDRYGVTGMASTRKWERFDERWDVAREPNEVNRFGWIVEIDPHDPTSTPVKHTALGRFKHEGAAVTIADDGRVVAYSGDDERFDYLYKFVSHGKVKRGTSALARRHNTSLLDDGTLHVAKFTGNSPGEIDGTGKLPADGEFDGVGEWIPLASGKESFVPGFTAEEVYVFTRLAADAVGATKMDRPEDVQPNPVNGKVYCALTNNSNRGSAGNAGADEANPRVGNKHGHVLEIDDDTTGTRFGWTLLLVCGDPDDPSTYFGGFDKSRVSPISCPDNVAFDRHGNLWLTTDGNALDSHDGLFAVPVEGPERGHVKQFLTVPTGAEACGPVVRDKLVTVSVQHPGEVDGASADEPASHWPDGGTSQPRPSVVAIWRADGGEIGRG
ncbi:PhoX family protein [Saccharopolyspora rhizosphaerae]|uniref:PhoX family protein n=1 Tax=Saccharopolyspora rhizosphaerae TaxID=2492662 RepID=UPI001F1E570A|nr:PhoX family phosphatase [Saccharopolyspora rhizosphaerae]